MKTIAELREKYDLHMEVMRYRDDDGMPKGDETLIRK